MSGCRCSRSRTARRSSPWREPTPRRSRRSPTRAAAGRSPRSARSPSPRCVRTGSARPSPSSPASSTPGSACTTPPASWCASIRLGGLDAATAAGLRVEVDAVLRRGARAGSSLRLGDTPFTLQTLGRGGHLRGVIAMAAGDLDQEGRGVVTAVIAMAGLALEQHQGLSRARGALRAGARAVAADGRPRASRAGSCATCGDRCRPRRCSWR